MIITLVESLWHWLVNAFFAVDAFCLMLSIKFKIIGTVFILSYVISNFLLFLFSSVMIFRYYYKKKFSRLPTIDERLLPSVAILVPAYNESMVINDTLNHLVTLDYPNYNIVVINDGSSDETMDVLHEEHQLQPVSIETTTDLIHQPIKGVWRSRKDPRIVVIDKHNGRKSDALNAGLNITSADYFVCIDADSFVCPEVLKIAMAEVLTYKEVIGVGCSLRIMEGATKLPDGRMVAKIPAKPIYAFQSIEYIRAFVLARMGWTAVNAQPLISGAFALYKKDIVVAAGGYRDNAIGDDSDMTLLVHEYMTTKRPEQKYRLSYIPEALCWTQVPADWMSLFNQRIRWQRGSMNGIYHRFKFFLTFKHLGLSLGAIPFTIIFTHLASPLELLSALTFIDLLLHHALRWDTFTVSILVAGAFWSCVTLYALLIDILTARTYRSPWVSFSFFFLSFIQSYSYGLFLAVASCIGFYRECMRWKPSHGSMKRVKISSVSDI
ncbi:MAG: glycosyltransferase [Vampirovibrionales bacterium]